MAVRIEVVTDVDAFAAAALPQLAADEANHTVLLSAVDANVNARARGQTPSEPWVGVVLREDGRVVASARRFRDNWNLSTGPAAAWRAFGAWAATQDFAGVAGATEAVKAFEQGHGGDFATHMDLPLFRLDGDARLPQPVTGRLRTATVDDLALLMAWTEAFRVEAGLDLTPEQPAGDVERGLRRGSQSLWIDADDRPCGLIAGSVIPPGGARIGPVYTPPALRGRGIGGAMVCALAQRLRDAGARCIFLFTDARNATSNALYARIGFAPAGRDVHRVRCAAAVRP